jgi:hypothetical protein
VQRIQQPFVNRVDDGIRASNLDYQARWSPAQLDAPACACYAHRMPTLGRIRLVPFTAEPESCSIRAGEILFPTGKISMIV